jgi:hypothetical protein
MLAKKDSEKRHGPPDSPVIRSSPEGPPCEEFSVAGMASGLDIFEDDSIFCRLAG